MPVKTEAIISHLRDKERWEGNPPLLLQFHQRLTEIQYEVEQGLTLPESSLTRDTIIQRMACGIPLLSFDDLAIDWVILQDVFTKVSAIFNDYPELFGKLPETLTDPGAGRLLTKKIVKDWFSGNGQPLKSRDINENLWGAILQYSLKPFLTSHMQKMYDLIDQNRWRRGYCPICAGSPDFAFLDTETGARWLVCHRCDAEWLFQRLECPYCGTKEQNALAYLTDDKDLYRLYVCEKCHRYLKAIDLRQAKSGVLLPLERLYTLDLDKQARDKGYTPVYGRTA